MEKKENTLTLLVIEEAVGCSDYVWSNLKVISEYWIRKDVWKKLVAEMVVLCPYLSNETG